MQMQSRGFSLMELVIALGIGAVLISVATVATVRFTGEMGRLHQRAHLDAEAKRLLDVIATRVQQVGGGAVRPWDVLDIENACGTVTVAGETLPDCDGSDRLRFVELDTSVPECVVQSGTTGQAVLQAGGACCLTAAHDQRAVTLIPPGGSGGWHHGTCAVTATPTTCRCAVSSGGGAIHSTFSAFSGSVAGASLAVAKPTVLFLERTTGVLSRLEAQDGSAAAARVDMSDRVVDFQVQYGFDASPVDGIVDRWESHVPAGHRPLLRMLRLGLIVQTRSPGTPGGTVVSVLDGPQRTTPPGKLYRAVQTDVQLRNVLVFQ